MERKNLNKSKSFFYILIKSTVFEQVPCFILYFSIHCHCIVNIIVCLFCRTFLCLMSDTYQMQSVVFLFIIILLLLVFFLFSFFLTKFAYIINFDTKEFYDKISLLNLIINGGIKTIGVFTEKIILKLADCPLVYRASLSFCL